MALPAHPLAVGQVEDLVGRGELAGGHHEEADMRLLGR
jgi:hypothetical protein